MSLTNAVLQPGQPDPTFAKLGGQEHPVQPGELWRGGDHLMCCADMTSAAHLSWLTKRAADPETRPKAIYCAPPWRDTTLAKWYDEAGAGKPPVAIDEVAATLLAIAQMLGVPTFLQLSYSNHRRATEAVRSKGGLVVGRTEMRYASGLYCVALGVTWGAPFDFPDLAQVRELDAPRVAFDGLALAPGSWVYDPFMGLGATALAAKALGLRALGTELSPYRTSACLVQLAADPIELAGSMSPT